MMRQFKDDPGGSGSGRQLQRGVMLLDDSCPFAFNIRSDNDMRFGMLLSERKDFRDREGFVNKEPLPREFIRDGVWERAAEEDHCHTGSLSHAGDTRESTFQIFHEA